MRDENLADYMINHHASSSFSQMVGDLYDIGYPVDEKVDAFFVSLQDKLDPALAKFLDFMRNGFENPQGDDLTDY